mmetsp:Transcript_38825/g.121724  ORF Transcript_38825/g.121724 Transcript_38825/m.121724 type:complete len:271 (+) Transcript_38825:163-975(+)
MHGLESGSILALVAFIALEGGKAGEGGDDHANEDADAKRGRARLLGVCLALRGFIGQLDAVIEEMHRLSGVVATLLAKIVHEGSLDARVSLRQKILVHLPAVHRDVAHLRVVIGIRVVVWVVVAEGWRWRHVLEIVRPHRVVKGPGYLLVERRVVIVVSERLNLRFIGVAPQDRPLADHDDADGVADAEVLRARVAPAIVCKVIIESVVQQIGHARPINARVRKVGSPHVGTNAPRARLAHVALVEVGPKSHPVGCRHDMSAPATGAHIS